VRPSGFSVQRLPGRMFMGDVGALAIGAGSHHRRDRAPGNRPGSSWARIRPRDRVGDDAGGVVKAHRQTHLSHGALLTISNSRLGGAQGHRAFWIVSSCSFWRVSRPEDPQRDGKAWREVLGKTGASCLRYFAKHRLPRPPTDFAPQCRRGSRNSGPWADAEFRLGPFDLFPARRRVAGVDVRAFLAR